VTPPTAAGGTQEHAPATLPEAGPAKETAARTAGRGGVAVLGAKVFFLVTGFVQQPILRLAVGLSDFGGLAQALVVANIVNNVVVQSATQGVSRVVAGAKGREPEALRATLRVHVAAAVIVAGIMALAAPVYGRFEHAEDIVVPLLVLAGVALLYGIYAPFVGYLNGRNLFGWQASLDMAFATFRTVGLIGVAYVFVRRGLSGVLGTTVGWVSAAALIIPFAVRRTGLGKALDPGAPRPASIPTDRAYLTMLAPIAGSQLCINLLMQVDIFLLGRFLSDGALAAGVAADGQRDAVKAWLAIYKECQTFAFLPYQLLFSITLVLFPMLARVHAENDHTAVRAYVARGARLAAIFCGLLVGVVVAMPQSMLAFAYNRADAAQGADVLRAMTLAQGAFAMLGIATTVLTSLGRERTTAWLTLAATAAVAAACATFVPGAGFGHAQLVRSAEASGVALGATLVVGAAIVRRRTGTFVSLATGVRVGCALAACLAVGYVMPVFPRLVTPVVAAVVGAAYVAFLVVTREIGRGDLEMLRGLAGRKRG
jgi:stage V sporulation protein B